MRKGPAALFLAVMCLAPGACGDAEDAGRDARPGKASGTILQRSISDDMLPYDTVTSQPPRARLRNAGSDAASTVAEEQDIGESPGAAEAPDASAALEPTPSSAAGSTPGAE